MYCMGRTHLGCGHEIFIRYPLTCTHIALRQCLMKRPRPTLRVYARLVPRLTYGLYHIKWLGGCLSLCISDAKMFATEGPDRGVIETIVDWCCGLFSQDRKRFFSRNP